MIQFSHIHTQAYESLHLNQTNYYYFGHWLTLHHHQHHNIVKSRQGIFSWSKNATIVLFRQIWISSHYNFHSMFLVFFPILLQIEPDYAIRFNIHFVYCVCLVCYSFVYIVHDTWLSLASDILMRSIVCFMMLYNCIIAEQVEHFPPAALLKMNVLNVCGRSYDGSDINIKLQIMYNDVPLVLCIEFVWNEKKRKQMRKGEISLKFRFVNSK